MLNFVARVPLRRVTDPLGRRLVAVGVSPDAVTVAGTLGTVAAALWFLPRGAFVAGAVIVAIFVLFDLLDGAMARARGHGTPFGAVLDSVGDRLADAALFAALVWWCLGPADERLLGAVALTCLVAGQLVSYVKARAEGAGLSAGGGLVERAERLILTILGVFLHGLGVPYALHVALGVLAVASVITVGQRIASVYRSAQQSGAPR